MASIYASFINMAYTVIGDTAMHPVEAMCTLYGHSRLPTFCLARTTESQTCWRYIKQLSLKQWIPASCRMRGR